VGPDFRNILRDKYLRQITIGVYWLPVVSTISTIRRFASFGSVGQAKKTIARLGKRKTTMQQAGPSPWSSGDKLCVVFHP
jgi:hypothetical protein